MRGTKMWSPVNTVSYPSSSPLLARAPSLSGVASGPLPGKVKPYFTGMPPTVEIYGSNLGDHEAGESTLFVMPGVRLSRFLRRQLRRSQPDAPGMCSGVFPAQNSLVVGQRCFMQRHRFFHTDRCQVAIGQAAPAAQGVRMFSDQNLLAPRCSLQKKPYGTSWGTRASVILP